MPELDAERRERLADLLAKHYGTVSDATLDALALLIAEWLADDTAVCTTCQHRGGDDQPAQHPGCAAALGRIRAGALREAAEEAEALRSFAHGKNPISEAHLIGYGTARRVIVRQLRDRADRIGGAS